MGLGTCPIGFAWGVLGLAEIRSELGIPSGYRSLLPIIVGFVPEFPESPGRQPAKILNWVRAKDFAEAAS